MKTIHDPPLSIRNGDRTSAVLRAGRRAVPAIKHKSGGTAEHPRWRKKKRSARERRERSGGPVSRAAHAMGLARLRHSHGPATPPPPRPPPHTGSASSSAHTNGARCERKRKDVAAEKRARAVVGKLRDCGVRVRRARSKPRKRDVRGCVAAFTFAASLCCGRRTPTRSTRRARARTQNDLAYRHLRNNNNELRAAVHASVSGDARDGFGFFVM